MPCDKNIHPTLDSSQHVIHMLAEHGPLFDTMEEGHPEFLGNIDCILVKSDKDDWVGWLPVHEIEIVVQEKTPCVSAVLRFLDVEEFEQAYNIPTMIELLREIDWVCDPLPTYGAKSVGQFRGVVTKELRQYNDYEYYLVFLWGHVLLLNNHGETIVDTAPRTRDKRKIDCVYGLNKSERSKFKSELMYRMHEKQQMEKR